ncbi:LWamide neuropeptides-like [Clytia hemisphaerica]|uniref:Uncharacterized protein n=1 Tax=Clytia hemisphaerica TaxID=252671 RepID=A0A7M5WQ31_9CNID
MDQSLSSILLLLCCWVALTTCMSVQRKEAGDALSALDKENAKKSANSITEELARNLMEHLYDEIRKRSDSNEETNSNFRRASSDTHRQQQAPKGLWGRELQPGNPPGLWGREASEAGNADSNDGPIPGMWGRREADDKNGHEKFQ